MRPSRPTISALVAVAVAGLAPATRPAVALPSPVEDSALTLARGGHRPTDDAFGPLPRHVLTGLVQRAGRIPPTDLPSPGASSPPCPDGAD